jgi:hypothetical protein
MPPPTKAKPLLALKTKQGELTLPLTRALWLIGRLVLQLGAGYVLLGWPGLGFAAALIIARIEGVKE